MKKVQEDNLAKEKSRYVVNVRDKLRSIYKRGREYLLSTDVKCDKLTWLERIPEVL